MEKVCPGPRGGQGIDPSHVRDACEPEHFVDEVPALEGAEQAGEVSGEGGAREAPGLPEATSTLLRERGCLPLRPSAHLAVKARAGQSEEETVLHSLARRAGRVVRPILQGVPRHELWVMEFDQACG
jgi:hypothetical protein